LPLDPALITLQPSWTHLPPSIDDPLQFRQLSQKAQDEGFDDFTLPGPDVAMRHVAQIGSGGETFNAVIYWPQSKGPHPVHVFLHGGGWTIGSAFSRDSEAASRDRCVRGDCIVVSLDYRKAPEHPYPAPVQDLLHAIEWITDLYEDLGALPGAITAGGQSSGANIVAAATLALRDEGRDLIRHQILEVPVLDLSHSIPRDQGDELPLSLSDVHTFSAIYLNGQDPNDPLASPLLARDLRGLPAAYIAVAEHDVLRIDGEQYADRLTAAGVETRLYLGRGHVHMSPSMTRVLSSARDWQKETTKELVRANAQLRAAAGQLLSHNPQLEPMASWGQALRSSGG